MCPGKPVGGKFIDGGDAMTEADIDNVVKQRIQKLENDLYWAKDKLRRGIKGMIYDWLKTLWSKEKE